MRWPRRTSARGSVLRDGATRRPARTLARLTAMRAGASGCNAGAAATTAAARLPRPHGHPRADAGRRCVRRLIRHRDDAGALQTRALAAGMKTLPPGRHRQRCWPGALTGRSAGRHQRMSMSDIHRSPEVLGKVEKAFAVSLDALQRRLAAPQASAADSGRCAPRRAAAPSGHPAAGAGRGVLAAEGKPATETIDLREALVQAAPAGRRRPGAAARASPGRRAARPSRCAP